ncbi:MAG: nickel-dependent hydrogenase large subunit [Candidatus Micrarchaeota archaeon]
MHNIESDFIESESDFSIGIENLSKIEGHAELEVKISARKVVDAKLLIGENKRFFSEAAIGKHALAIPQLVSRICGTCSVAHLLASIDAIENAFGLEPSAQTINLRKLLMNGTHIRDHAMHLYMFCLPDLFKKDSILDFDENDEKQHNLIHKAFTVKSTGNKLATIVGGRAVHSPFALVGGFLKIPTKEEIKETVSELKKARGAALEFIEIFYQAEFSFKSDAYFVALLSNDYNYITGQICGDAQGCILKSAFDHYLERVVIPYSQARGFTYKEKPYIVGALARMNYNKRNIHKETKRDVKKYLAKFPSLDVYHNNLAQAIEIVHDIDASIELLETIDLKAESVKKADIKKSIGIGVVEAPRGLLYYKIMTESDGRIIYTNFVIPTAQNQIKMERDLGLLVQKRLDAGKTKEEIKHEMETLIRAYDPCMSCATNFLKIKWKTDQYTDPLKKRGSYILNQSR